MSFSRKLRRRQADAAAEEAALRLPVGRVVNDPIRGDFPGLPVLGWIQPSPRKEGGVSKLVLAFLLISEKTTPAGLVYVEHPVYPETEPAIISLLGKLGWTGRIWPRDPGWPDGTPDEDNIRHFLSQAQLAATLVFEPVDNQHATFPLSIQRARGPFLMPPLPQPEDSPDQNLVDKFRDAINLWKSFYDKE